MTNCYHSPTRKTKRNRCYTQMYRTEINTGVRVDSVLATMKVTYLSGSLLTDKLD